jgi:N-acetylmuramic acid 6-phosphate etherase
VLTIRNVEKTQPLFDRCKMTTERPSPRYSSIDVWDAGDILDSIMESQFVAVAAVRSARLEIESAAIAIARRLRHRGRLVYTGAGTSGRLAVQDGIELIPTFGWPENRLVLMIAGGPDALLKTVEGAEDEVGQAVNLTALHRINEDDVMIAVAASGTTPFTLACLREGTKRGALTVGIANNANTAILLESNHPIYLDTGSEPIAGSTRMKAGTAQKVALNALSTLLMILLGKVHQGRMIDVRVSNEKLLRRSVQILVDITGCNQENAQEALRRAERNVKVAVLLLKGCELKAAKELLDRTNGQLREAIDLITSPDKGP